MSGRRGFCLVLTVLVLLLLELSSAKDGRLFVNKSQPSLSCIFYLEYRQNLRKITALIK